MLISSEDSAELLDCLHFLLNPIRELFAKEQGLTEMLQHIAVLDSRFQHDTVQEVDWTRPLSTDFSLRRGLSRKDLAGFAASITENDAAHFSHLCGKDFQRIASGRLDPIDDRLLKFGDDIRACVTADVDLVESIAELTMVC